MYRLENNHGRKKVKCPQCGRRSLTLYVDEATGEPISYDVGRCDHQSSCGYHHTPKQYFASHPDGDLNRGRYAPIMTPVSKAAPKKVCYFPDGESSVRRSEAIETTFDKFLKSIIPLADFERVRRLYHIGGCRGKAFRYNQEHNRTVFWQIDIEGKVRSGKTLVYKADGHRDKNINPSWVHCLVSIPDDWTLSQCLFGEHLLRQYPDKTVVLVEAEKTAIIGSAIYPDYVWLATGGKTSSVVSKCQVLSGRHVIIYPDIDGHEDWTQKAKEIQKTVKDCKVVVSNILKNHCTPDEVKRQIDIADWMIEHLINQRSQV